MSLLRWLILLLSSSISLGLMFIFIAALQQLYWQVASFSLPLASLLLVLLVGLLLVMGGTLLYTVRLFPVPRELTIAVGLSLILGLMLWLIGSLQQLYEWIASPLLGSLLSLLLCAVLLTLLGALVYYLWLFRKPGQQSRRNQRRRFKLPTSKTAVARETLQAVQQQIDQIQDEVARRALSSRTEEIAASLSRRELRVVIFGTGSAGKTALVNALLGLIVGRVEAPMGTTETGKTYRLSLKGLDRKILITDTPGITEVGATGSRREQLARQLATEADLLLFVIDNDLQQSEYKPLSQLAAIGKRMILVFNKIDLYSHTDREAILGRLREHLRPVIGAADIVSVAARPQPVVLEDGRPFRPRPQIRSLIQRMATVLHAEGEELIADNILLQAQHLGVEVRQLLDAQRRRQAEKIVERFQWVGAGVIAVTPLPVIDFLATAAVNAQMVVEIGRVYGCELNLERGRELAISLARTLVSLGIVKGVTSLLSTTLEFHVGTLLIGRAIQGVSGAYLTRIAGQSFIEYFRQNQDWGDGGMTEVVQQQFQLNRRDEFMKAFVQEAIARVVEPLKQAAESDGRST